jgi:hypothetical protein
MSNWSPIAILPNLSLKNPIEGHFVAFAGTSDARVVAICQASRQFRELLSRFTDAFGVAIDPAVLIARDDKLPISADAFLSFRDLVVASIIPYSRSLNTVYRNSNRIAYSNSFWIYPWMINTQTNSLTMSTPALTAFHVVEQFGGQSTPELSVMQVDNIDEPLFEALLARWTRHYFGKRARWADRALFRSLNTAFHAAALPGGVGVTLFDLGRNVSLWVSALEILSHPRIAKAGLSTVYPLFERITYCNDEVGRRKYSAYNPNRKKNVKEPRRPLPCWIYGKLYQARNHFLHGNRVSIKTLSPTNVQTGLFWLAPSLYRLALSSFLDLAAEKELPYWLSNDYECKPKLREKRLVYDRQSMVERALLRIRKEKV